MTAVVTTPNGVKTRKMFRNGFQTHMLLISVPSALNVERIPRRMEFRNIP